MAPPIAKLFLSVLVLTDNTFSDQSSAFSFAINSNQFRQRTFHPSQQISTTFRPPMSSTDKNIRGGAAASTSGNGSAAAAPKKKVRISSFDGIRFLLSMHIVLGHFVRFANPPDAVMKFFAQVNVTVAAFFALSGYVTAYASTEVGELKASPRLTGTPSQKWTLSKAMSYYPLHWLVCLLFSPMFLYIDLNNGNWMSTAINAILSLTLTQSWFPGHAETWNPPMWFLSSLTFATALVPFSLPKIASMGKAQLSKLTGWMWLIATLPKLGYCYDHGAWAVVEGMTPPKLHPNYDVFQMHRFHPLFNVAEVLLGAVVCRIVMLDGADDSDKDKSPKTNWLSTAVPLTGCLGILTGRAVGWIPDVSDMLVRTVLFVPLFLKFLVAAHRNTVQGVKDPIVSFLSNKVLAWFGGLAFPIFIVHGPIGQVFYKRLIAGKLWGGPLMGPGFFGLYLATVLATAWLLQVLFLQNQSVKNWSKKRVDQFASWM